MNTALLTTLLCFATYRITRLLIRDTFPPVRIIMARIVGKDEKKLEGTKLEWLGELLTCYWCASVWVSSVLVIMTQVATSDLRYPLLVWPTAAAVGALMIHREDGPVSPQSVTYNITPPNE